MCTQIQQMCHVQIRKVLQKGVHADCRYPIPALHRVFHADTEGYMQIQKGVPADTFNVYRECHIQILKVLQKGVHADTFSVYRECHMQI